MILSDPDLKVRLLFDAKYLRNDTRYNQSVTVTIDCIISEIKRDIGRKSRFFHTPAFDAPPPVRGPARSNAMKFGVEELE